MIRCGVYPVAVAAAGAGIEVGIAAAGVSNEIPAVVGALDPAAGGGAEGPGAVCGIGDTALYANDVLTVHDCLSGVAIVVVAVAVVVFAVAAAGGIVVHDYINLIAYDEADHVSAGGVDGINGYVHILSNGSCCGSYSGFNGGIGLSSGIGLSGGYKLVEADRIEAGAGLGGGVPGSAAAAVGEVIIGCAVGLVIKVAFGGDYPLMSIGNYGEVLA